MRRRWRIAAWLVVVLALYAVAVLLALDVVREKPFLGHWYVALAGGAAIALVLLVLVIARALWRVRQRARQGLPGARLTKRLVARFALIAVPPALVVYAFSLNFLLLTVDAWFNVNLERALDDSLQLSRLYVDRELADARVQSRTVAQELAGVPDARLQQVLGNALDHMDALQLAVLSARGRSLALASADPRLLQAPRPGAAMLTQLRNEGHYAAAEPLDNRLLLRVLLPVPRAGHGHAYLQALYPLPEAVTTLTHSVESAHFDFQRLKFLRGALKLAFTLILTFVVLLSLLAALLAAVSVARRLLAPLGELATATRTLAEGSYDINLKPGADDELGFLSESFRDMTGRLCEADAEARASAAEIERQRSYLDTVLEHLSAGVLGVAADGVLQKANRAAGIILDGDPSAWRGHAVDELVTRETRLAPLLESIHRHQREGQREWHEEVRLRDAAGEVRILMVRGSVLGGNAGGMVVVFDDLTELNRAQRDSAWAEVAQRLAHEVKNPLTPIQLSAERMQHRLAGKLDERDAGLVQRATTTIVNQVDALKRLVNDFSDYARTPKLAAEPLAPEQVLREVLDLHDNDPAIHVTARLDAGKARIMADPGKLRQLLHNLIRNAREAVPEGDLELDIDSRIDNSQWQLRVADNGKGLPEGFDQSWFEPYVTTKAEGSGLGLAVVKKICEEHGGHIRARNRDNGGAEFTVTWPVV